MVTVLHAADFHLDSAFTGLSSRQAVERRAQSRQTVARLVDYGSDHGADLLLLAGDLFDSDDLYGQTAGELAKALGEFRGQVVIAPGNHDCYSAKSAWCVQTWPENVHIFTDDSLTHFDFPEYGCRVYGAAFTAAEHRQGDTLADFTAKADLVNIGLLHGEVGAKNSRYRPISLGEIRSSGLTYLALGHVHACSGLQKAGNTVWAYPGCLEGRGFDETGEKGFLFGTVARGEVRLQFVPFSQQRYEVLTVDVTDRTPLEAIEDRLPRDATKDIYRIVLTGETEQSIHTEELSRQLEGRFFAVELRDKTTLRQDIWARQDEDSLRGLFLREMREKYETAADDENRQKVVLAVRFGLHAMDNREM